MRKVNLQLFADGAKTEPPAKEETIEPSPAKKENAGNEDIGKQLEKILKLLTPKEPEQKEVVQVPTPKPATPANPETEVKPKEVSTWEKFWKAIW